MENGLLIVIIIVLLFGVIYFGLKKFGLKVIQENERERLENDAKRFAWLLIAEIKLYENYKIQRGLKNNSLYESLRDEIETARKKYKKQVTYKEFDEYFEDALVDVLADGDRSKLGMISNSIK